eukprot:6568943-Karenia_brevis.AAC.1
MIQGVEENRPWVENPQVQVDTGVRVDACSVENEVNNKKSWHAGAVEKIPHAIRSKCNRFEEFRRPEEDDESDDEDDEYVNEIPNLESSSDESSDEVVKSRGP